MIVGVGGWSTRNSGWKADRESQEGATALAGGRAITGSCSAGASNHGLLEVNGSLYKLTSTSRLGNGLPVRPDKGWEDPQIPQRYRLVQPTLSYHLRGQSMLKPPPTHQRMDNGPRLITNTMQVWIARDGCSAAYISPVSPLEKAFVESFNSRYRDKFLNIELFIPAVEVFGSPARIRTTPTNALSAPGIYTPGGQPLESGLTTHQLTAEMDQQCAQ